MKKLNFMKMEMGKPTKCDIILKEAKKAIIDYISYEFDFIYGALNKPTPKMIDDITSEDYVLDKSEFTHDLYINFCGEVMKIEKIKKALDNSLFFNVSYVDNGNGTMTEIELDMYDINRLAVEDLARVGRVLTYTYNHLIN